MVSKVNFKVGNYSLFPVCVSACVKGLDINNWTWENHEGRRCYMKKTILFMGEDGHW